MKAIRRNGGEYTDLLYRSLDAITMDELKDAIMYAFDHGTEEVKEPKIPYVKTNIFSIVKAIKSSFAMIETVQIDYIDPDAESKDILADKFIDYLMHLSQSGIFADTIKWRYVDLFNSGDYLLEGDINHNNGYELNVSIATKNKEDKSKVAEMLRKEEECEDE